MPVSIEAFHLQTPAGFRFCVLRKPSEGSACHGAIIHVPAFAEEMNKSRRMVALQADAWAQDGWMVLQIDFGGCGDSEGDFADAGWDGWLEDVRYAHEWASAQTNGPVWLWGLRLGAVLAAEAADRFQLECGLLLWQPVVSGKQHLQQFLRMWKMAQVVGKSGPGDELPPQQRLAAGETVEIAGYAITPDLARGMEASSLTAAAAVPLGVHWFQLSPAGEVAPSPAFERLERQWAGAGFGARHHALVGPSFWQSQEIEVAQDLIDRSRRVLAALTMGRV